MARLVALYSSVPQSGKTTIANHLEVNHSYTRLKFAGALKAMLYTLLKAVNPDDQWAYACIEGDLKEKPLPMLGGKSPRDLMISLGTEWGRKQVHPSIWVDVLKVQATAALYQGKDVVIDDLRFPNEYYTLLSLATLQGHDVHLVKVEKTGGEAAGDQGRTEGLLCGLPFHITLTAPEGQPGQLLDMMDEYLALKKAS